MTPVSPSLWSEAELDAARKLAIEAFREERMSEPLEIYYECYQHARESIETILEMSTDLTRIDDFATTILGDKRLAETARYLASPPISKDDLETLADVTMAPTLVQKDPERAKTLLEIILLGLDRERFAWLREAREPLESEVEAAIVSTAAMQAMRNVETRRRNEGKDVQEARTRDFLEQECGFKEVPTRKIDNLSKAPESGTFCRECEVGSRKADIVIRLWDGRLMPIECKVSNSETNSYKRINNDAAVKAVAWRNEFGTANIVPAAVLSGVFALANLTYAQDRGLSLLWAMDLESLKDFLAAAR